MLPIGKDLLLFDGGMGSEIEKAGVPYVYPEDLNITHPELIAGIHQSYRSADFITTNTFGLNRIKYKGDFPLSDLCRAAIANARTAGRAVFFDMGPTGTLLSPIGTLSFDGAYAAFAEMVELSRDLVDGYILETFSDIYELKAAVLAVKEHSNKPVFATMTFDASDRTLTGTTPEIMVEVLEGLAVDALGANCSLGPKELMPIAARILAAAHVPVILQPNLGLPTVQNAKTVYTLSEGEFAEAAKEFARMGVSLLGGCCGTTPACIEALIPLRGQEIPRKEPVYLTRVCSATRLVDIEDGTVCGERLNPTGKKKVKEALLSGDYAYLVGEAIRQEEAGADLLDLNVGLPQIDEALTMRAVCARVQEYTDLPLQIDSSNPEAIEAGVRYYNGIPLINSVNGEADVMARIFPIAKKYGAVVLGLTMDAAGIPETAEKRAAIAARIIDTAAAYGIPRHKIMIDTLVLTASAEQRLVKETLRALPLVRAMGVHTALGVSNVSFGLPARPLLNRTFLAMAMGAGLSMPILNPLDPDMMGAVRAYRVLAEKDPRAEAYIAAYADAGQTLPPAGDETLTLPAAIKRGLREEAARCAKTALATHAPLQIVENCLIPTLDEVGGAYAAGKLFLPQLMAAAEAARAAFDEITAAMPEAAAEKGTVVLATVKGDVHDIGKNIVGTVLRSYGYRVIDLGKDVPPEAVVSATLQHTPAAVGLSALMTTTVASMQTTIAALRAAGCPAPIFVGGAVLNPETATAIGADIYTKDALEFVEVLSNIQGAKS